MTARKCGGEIVDYGIGLCSCGRLHWQEEEAAEKEERERMEKRLEEVKRGEW